MGAASDLRKRLGPAMGVMLVAILVAMATAIALTMSAARADGAATVPAPTPREVTFRLVIQGDPPPTDLFVVRYRRSMQKGTIPLCGDMRLYESNDSIIYRDGQPGAPDTGESGANKQVELSSQKCRAGVYTETVAIPWEEFEYGFDNIYTDEFGEQVVESFAGSPPNEYVPTQPLYAAAYTYPPGAALLPKEPQSPPEGGEGIRPEVLGKIASVPHGRVAGLFQLRTEDGHDYIVGVGHETRILMQREGQLYAAHFQDLELGQRVRVWLLEGLISIGNPLDVSASAIVIEEQRGGVSSGRVSFVAASVVGLLVVGVLAMLVRGRYLHRARSGMAAFLGPDHHRR